MVEIHVSPDRLRSVASSLENQQQEVDALLSNTIGLVNNLQGEWLGMAQIDYATRFNDEVPSMRTSIAEILEELIQALRHIADEFEQTDSTVVSGVAGVGLGISGAVGAAIGGAGVGAAIGGAGAGTASGGNAPLTQFPYPPGSDQWNEADKAGDCWRYASQRSGNRLKHCPDGFARSLPSAYPPEKKFSLSGNEQDLRDHIKPGMAIVWQPPAQRGPNWPEGRSPLYGVDAQGGFTPPPPNGYYDDVRYAASGGHVAIVEEVGTDYIVVSDQYGKHRIDQHGRYKHNGLHDDVNFLVGPTFIDLT